MRAVLPVAVRACTLIATAYASLANPRLWAGGINSSPLRSVAVILDYDQPFSDVSQRAMQRELNVILLKVGLQPQLYLKSQLPENPQFENLVMFRMKGFCSMHQELPVSALSDERGALAMTYSSNGQLLSFGAVECDRIKRCLTRSLHNPGGFGSDLVLGRALGRVVAHEMYHMLGNAKQHTTEGVTKERFSARDLSEGELRLSDDAQLAFTKQLPR